MSPVSVFFCYFQGRKRRLNANYLATYVVSLLTLRCRRDVHIKLDNRAQLQIFAAVSRIILLYTVMISFTSIAMAVVKVSQKGTQKNSVA